MIRRLMAAALLASVASAGGCAMCSDCTDTAPTYAGGYVGHAASGGYNRAGSGYGTEQVVDTEAMTHDTAVIETIDVEPEAAESMPEGY
jgi:hypothetical protein